MKADRAVTDVQNFVGKALGFPPNSVVIAEVCLVNKFMWVMAGYIEQDEVEKNLMWFTIVITMEKEDIEIFDFHSGNSESTAKEAVNKVRVHHSHEQEQRSTA